jgi:hypothetical protein
MGQSSARGGPLERLGLRLRRGPASSSAAPLQPEYQPEALDVATEALAAAG